MTNQLIIIKKELTLKELLEDIDNEGHKVFMDSLSGDNREARKAMTRRIKFYLDLIRNDELVILNSRRNKKCNNP